MFDDASRSPITSPEGQQGASLLAALPGYPSRGGTPLPRPIGSGATVTTSMSAPSAAGYGSVNGQNLVEELRQARREIESLKSMVIQLFLQHDPFHAAEMAIELQMEKMRCVEAVRVRDSAVQRLSSAYDSIKEKATTIGRLQSEKADLECRLANAEARIKEAAEQARVEERQLMEGELARLRDVIRSLKDSVEAEKETRASATSSPVITRSINDSGSPNDDASSCITAVDSNGYGENILQSLTNGIDHLAIGQASEPVSPLHGSGPGTIAPPCLKLIVGQELQAYRINHGNPADMVRARNAVLTALPMPPGIPEDELKPIILPASLSIHEFLNNCTAVSNELHFVDPTYVLMPYKQNSLTGYRIFHETTTRWCPEREEHGYFLTPLYKCTTKARVSTAHSWSEVDPRGRMMEPTECFYNRQGKWYYAGQYVALRLDDFSSKEWNDLDSETSAMLVKETLAGRKNTSPTVHYEVSQLYSAGALKIACVGLQCVGFNLALYETIMEQAAKCRQGGRWKTGWGATSFPTMDGSDNTGNNGTTTENTNAYSASLFNFL
ncbi:uncharacterized protein FOMMEDRAFT_153619 [Fomitiporia mediterranea MF3/22]|uniref:uncharacterized protein n=1 Tax=Fomitiporia mediterranea (strain MF3/22) TaxID=694068 RepID=UPI0004407B1C|nr:uncharacterized protein FOMMEDRAFT_153619 [Fomitiporia mediterranea MF3/22]EJD06218.1 hypothetical protein FOMMEDRAFT_153619 [Fomitiporia mediterranea MF3/22]